MTNSNIEKYILLAPKYTKEEISKILNLKTETIRKYASKTGIKAKPTHYHNITTNEWVEKFNKLYNGSMFATNPHRTKTGHIRATITCVRCQTSYECQINTKISKKTGCMKCDMGNHGNKYTLLDCENMLNSIREGHWTILHYENYSKRNNIIKCNLCGNTLKVKLSEWVSRNKQCPNCESGSFPEKIIATTLMYNNIPFERQFEAKTNNTNLRIDFLINNNTALEYHGDQHFEKKHNVL